MKITEFCSSAASLNKQDNLSDPPFPGIFCTPDQAKRILTTNYVVYLL